MASFLDIFDTVAPAGLAVLSEVKGRDRNSKRQRMSFSGRVVFGIRLMQILAAIKASKAPASPEASALCFQSINELGSDVRPAILAGYKEIKKPAPLSDDDITKAL